MYRRKTEKRKNERICLEARLRTSATEENVKEYGGGGLTTEREAKNKVSRINFSGTFHARIY